MLNQRFASPSLDIFPRLEAAADIVVKAASLLAFTYLMSGYLGLPTLPVYGHDEVHYHEFYRFALFDDGRWLNYLLHGYLRSIPLPVWSVLYVGLWWTLLYRMARACAFDLPFAALVASAILIASPFVEISLWPATFVPALGLVWLAVWMQARGIAYPIIYLVSGVLIFGTIQTLYFVLPLLFLPQFLDTSQPMRARWLLLLKHMAWWVAGSVAGTLVLCVMLWFLIGIWFPQPAPWRNTQPIHDLPSLVANVRYIGENFYVLLKLLLLHGGILKWSVILACVAVAVVRARSLLAQAPGLALLGAVLISFFVFNLPLAPYIHMRSLIAMAAALILGLAILPGQTPLGRIFAAVLLLKLVFNYQVVAKDSLELQRAETAAYMRVLEDLFPGYPMGFSALALDGMMDPARPEARRFNDYSLMQPLLVSLGVSNIMDCRVPGRCDSLDPGGTPISTREFAGGQLELSVNAANIGIIRYRATSAPPQQ